MRYLIHKHLISILHPLRYGPEYSRYTTRKKSKIHHDFETFYQHYGYFENH